MSVNIYDSQSGNLQNVASGQRTWVGTKVAYKAAKQAGTLPNNAIIAITDDEQDHNHYSTEETETGMYWIDGKPIYRKVVDCGALPSTAGDKNTAHNISNLGTVVKLNGFCRTNSGLTLPVPYAATNAITSMITLGINTTNIIFSVATDRSSYTSSWVIVEYTKTTD